VAVSVELVVVGDVVDDSVTVLVGDVAVSVVLVVVGDVSVDAVVVDSIVDVVSAKPNICNSFVSTSLRQRTPYATILYFFSLIF